MTSKVIIFGGFVDNFDKTLTKLKRPDICLRCTKDGVFSQLPAVKKTPFLVHLKQNLTFLIC